MKARVTMLLIFSLLGFGLARMVITSGTAEVHQEDATPIQVGIMTEKQKAHSKLFENYKTNRKLDALPLPDENDKDLEQGVFYRTWNARYLFRGSRFEFRRLS